MKREPLNIELAKRWWRPALAWVFVTGWCATLSTVLALLWLDKTTVADASGLLIALVAGGAAPVTTYTHGRTQEKKAEVENNLPELKFNGEE